MRVSGGPLSLNNLPDELLVQILEALPAQRDLCALCLVNRRMNAVADPVLHKSISFEHPHHHLTFSKSLTTRPRRGSLIQNVRLEYSSAELSDLMYLEESRRIDRFSHTISTMSNLEHLVVSVPESLCHGIGTLFNGPFDLACLKTCSLFYQRDDGGYWDLQENIQIFGHPILETLTIRRARLDQKGFDSLEKPSETGLKRLQLLECDINDDALADILLLPEALIEFTITQLEVPCPPLEESPDDIEDYIFALHSARHSLELISIDFPTLGAGSALRLREFDTIRSLQLRDYQLFGQSRGSPRLHSVGLPPNVQTIEFLHPFGEDEEIVDLLCYTLQNKGILARKWRQMIVVGRDGHSPPTSVMEACVNLDEFELQLH